MQSESLSSDYPWDQFPLNPVTESENVPVGASPPFKFLKTLPPVPLFRDESKTSTKASTKTSTKPPLKKRAPNASAKRFVKPNWLSDATAAKQKAGSDTALLNGGVVQEEWVKDLGGVYNNKEDGTWYTLDHNGGNPSPVCGQPFSDPYFDGIRTWETLDERSQAIQSHQSLLEMANM